VDRPEPAPFATTAGPAIRGEAVGEGPPLALLHGLTATRRYVVHGSLVLPRNGYRAISYDARGHGESDPAPPGEGYGYPEMAADLGAVLDAQTEGRAVLVGHSMGAHTAVAFALENPERVAALVVIGPVYMSGPDDEDLERWERLAGSLEREGIDGFVEAAADGAAPEWIDVVRRITRERMQAHRHLDAIARALREVPRSEPFGAMSELEFLDVPALVVASHDEADPYHPHAVAEAYARALPDARLVSEEPGQSPLAWQGGRLSREIAAFCSEPAVAERLRAYPSAAE
jgi:pimeloyl-ACP methyl ester carboxylesterase